MSLKKITIIAAISVLMAAAGCAKAPPRRAGHLETGTRTQAAALLQERIGAYRESTRTIKALAWVVIGDGEEERETDAALAIERPDKIRADAIDSLADVWAQVGTDGRTMWLYLPARSKLYSGKATAQNLYRLAKFDFGLPELLDVLAGSPPVPSDAQILQVAGGRAAHFVVSGSQVHLWTERAGGRPSRVARFGQDGSTIEYSASFADYRKVGGAWFPHRIEAQFPSRGARIAIVYKDVELGKAQDQGAFMIPGSGRVNKVKSLDR